MSDTSSNGSNGAFRNHDRLGRFVKNNTGGPGNPFGRKVAALRSALLASVTAQDVQEVLAAVLAQAKKGNVSAARLFLAYTAGKPADTVNPDEADADEWQLTQKNVARPEEIKHTFEDMPVQLANTVARATLPAIGDGMAINSSVPDNGLNGLLPETHQPSTTLISASGVGVGGLMAAKPEQSARVTCGQLRGQGPRKNSKYQTAKGQRNSNPQMKNLQGIVQGDHTVSFRF